MGTHERASEPTRILTPPGAQLITVQAWHVMDKTHLTAFVTAHADGGPKSFNTGAEILDYRLLDLPSLGQVMWCLGDEIRESWRELSHPKV